MVVSKENVLIPMIQKMMEYSLLKSVFLFKNYSNKIFVFHFGNLKVKDGSPASGLLTVGTRILEVR
jgi:hypothetical protein